MKKVYFILFFLLTIVVFSCTKIGNNPPPPHGGKVSGEVIQPAESTIDVNILSSGTWNQTGAMLLSRSRHTATLLPDGTVLAAGGLTGSLSNVTTSASAEVYNSAAGTWSSTQNMSVPRSRFSATLLSNGLVLVAGGSTSSGLAIPTAELYDFHTATWSTTGSMSIPRIFHTATLLADGRVLVTGGLSAGNANDNFVEKTAEIYDPTTGKWTLVNKMSKARYGHTATLLADGAILVVGGAGPRGDLVYTVRAEIFDPYTNTWKNGGSILTPRGFHTSVLLMDGNVLIAGGLTLPANSSNRTTSAEIFQASIGKWILAGSMTTPRSAGVNGGALFPDGRFLIVGGRTNTTEIYDPNISMWNPTGDMTVSRSFHTVTLLSNGNVLVTGGENAEGSIATAEIFMP